MVPFGDGSNLSSMIDVENNCYTKKSFYMTQAESGEIIS